jgi:hypothetical protein
MTVQVVTLPAMPIVVHPCSRAVLRFEHGDRSSRCRYDEAAGAFRKLREICGRPGLRRSWMSSFRIEVLLDGEPVLSELAGDVADDMARGGFEVYDVEPISPEDFARIFAEDGDPA